VTPPIKLGFARRVLLPLLILYALASVLHFTHNAEYIDFYPNLPAWITRGSVYVVWWVIFAIGVSGYALYRSGRILPGLFLMALYAGLGLDGMLHYTRAPMHAHTAAMNLSIWIEAITAAAALASIFVLTIRHAARFSTAVRPNKSLERSRDR
jgi:hypothetical protein